MSNGPVSTHPTLGNSVHHLLACLPVICHLLNHLLNTILSPAVLHKLPALSQFYSHLHLKWEDLNCSFIIQTLPSTSLPSLPPCPQGELFNTDLPAHNQKL